MQVPDMRIPNSFSWRIQTRYARENDLLYLFNRAVRLHDFEYVASFHRRFPWPSGPGNAFPMGNYSEPQEFRKHLRANGVLFERLPGAILWKWNDADRLMELADGFCNCESVIWGRSNPGVSLEYLADRFGEISECELHDKADSWNAFAQELVHLNEYFMTTLVDFTGFLLISRSKEEILGSVERWGSDEKELTREEKAQILECIES